MAEGKLIAAIAFPLFVRSTSGHRKKGAGKKTAFAADWSYLYFPYFPWGKPRGGFRVQEQKRTLTERTN